MSFTPKTWVDRVSEYPNRRKLTDTTTSVETIVTVARAEGTVSADGDAFDAATMNDLEERIEDGFDDLNGLKLWKGTQAQYDLLTPSSDTIYFILES